MEREIKYIEKAENYTMKDQKAQSDNPEEYRTINDISVYLKYEENLFEDLLELEKIEDKEKKEELKNICISFLISALSMKYKKYLQSLDNSISRILILLKKDFDYGYYITDMVYFFKNKHIKENLYTVIENYGWFKINSQEKLIQEIDEIEENNEKIKAYRFNPDPIVNRIDSSIMAEQLEIIEKLKDYYNIYIANNDEKSYDDLYGDIHSIAEYGSTDLADLFDNIMTYNQSLVGACNDTNAEICGIYTEPIDFDNDWNFDILNQFNGEPGVFE